MTTSPRHALCALLFALPLAAQSASGPTHFLVASEAGTGGDAQSVVHRLTATFSSGVAAARATSAGFVLLGGFPAAIEATVGGPWLTGVTPAYGPLFGGTPLTLHGAGLNQGPILQLAIGGQPAVPGPRTNASLQTTLPAQPRPGYQSVLVQDTNGSATLPRGVGILPLIDFPVAHRALVPLDLRYIGAQNDQVVVVLALGTLPFVLPLPPFHHGLELDLSTLVVLSPVPVTRSDGELRLTLPAAAPPVPIFFQAFSLTQSPGWFPGSFTNVALL